MEEDNKKGWKQLINSEKFYRIVSLAIILYLVLIVTPYADKVDMFSEGHSPNKSELAIYRLMIWPISIIYLIYTKKIGEIHPLTVITSLFLLWYFLPTLGGGSAIWLLFYIIPLLLFILFAWGIVKVWEIIEDAIIDKKEKQQNKQIQEDEEEQ